MEPTKTRVPPPPVSRFIPSFLALQQQQRAVLPEPPTGDGTAACCSPFPLPNPFTFRAQRQTTHVQTPPEVDIADAVILDLANKLIKICKDADPLFAGGVQHHRLFKKVALSTVFMPPTAYINWVSAKGPHHHHIQHAAVAAAIEFDGDICGPTGALFPEVSPLSSSFAVTNPVLAVLQKIPSADSAYKRVVSTASSRAPSVRESISAACKLFNARCAAVVSEGLSVVEKEIRNYHDTFLPLIHLEMRAEIAKSVTSFLVEYATATSNPAGSQHHHGGGRHHRRDKNSISSFWTSKVTVQSSVPGAGAVVVQATTWPLKASDAAATNHPLLKAGLGGGRARINSGDIVVLEVGDQGHGFKGSRCCLGIVKQADLMTVQIEAQAGPQLTETMSKQSVTSEDLRSIFESLPFVAKPEHRGPENIGSGQGMVLHVVGSISQYQTMVTSVCDLFKGGVGHGSLLCGTTTTKAESTAAVGIRNMKHFNWAQSAAIQAACEDVKPLPPAVEPRYQTVVVEGPPGTGKTHTIVGITSSILHEAGVGARVLMCAPSNAAVDEVALRLHKVGLISRGDLGQYEGRGQTNTTLSILRVGVAESIEPAVREAGLYLDDKVELVLERELSCPAHLRAEVRKRRRLTESELDELASWRRRIPQKNRREAAKTVIEESNVICATLGSVHQVSSALETRSEVLSGYLVGFLSCCTDIVDGHQSGYGGGASARPHRLRPVEGTVLASHTSLPTLELNCALSVAERILVRKGFVEAPDTEVEEAALGRAKQFFMSQSPPAFSAIIVDESSQATEPQTLMPLICSRGCRKLVLVGDPAQLRPTVLSRRAELMGFQNSLILRLAHLRSSASRPAGPPPRQCNPPSSDGNPQGELPAIGGLSLFHSDPQSRVAVEQLPQYGCRVRWVRLVQQYRMHPSIVRFPNAAFYQGTLRNGRFEDYWTRPPSTVLDLGKFHMLESRVRFFDVVDGELSKGGGGGGGGSAASDFTSSRNYKEAVQVVAHVRSLVKSLFTFVLPWLREHESPGGGSFVDYLSQLQGPEDVYRQIGIITFYKAQEKEIRRLIGPPHGPPEEHLIQVSSVDGFQGKEKVFIFLSCVRAPFVGGGGGSGSLGFLRDANRMNVALTRAKEFCFVFGHAATLSSGSVDMGRVGSRRGRDGAGEEFAEGSVAPGDHWAGLVMHCYNGERSKLEELAPDGTELEASLSATQQPSAAAPLQRPIVARTPNDSTVSVGFTTVQSSRDARQVRR